MRILRGVLRWFFAVNAAAFFLAVADVSTRHGSRHAALPWARTASLVGLGLVGALFTVAWWTNRRSSPITLWSRVSAIVSSVLILSEGVTILAYGGFSLTGSGLIEVAVGIAGIVVFSLRGAPPAIAPVGRGHGIAGDRASHFMEKVFTAVAIAAQFAGMRWWSTYAFVHGLPHHPGLVYVLAMLGISLFLVIIVHELGHAAVGLVLGMKLLGFRAGPLHWQLRQGKWEFEFQRKGIAFAGGGVRVVPTDLRQPRWQELCMIAAGPLANVWLGLLITGLLFVPGALPRSGWEFFTMTSTLSLVAAMTNLLPFRTKEGAYSDGARMLQLLTNSPMLDLYRALASASSTLVTERRPRDFDLAAIERVSPLIQEDFLRLHLRMLAANCLEDRGEVAEACASLAAADALFCHTQPKLTTEYHTVFVFNHAWLTRDAVAARSWWQRMEAQAAGEKKPQRLTMGYWQAKAALAWVEGRGGDALTALDQSDAAAQTLPRTGIYEAMRESNAKLRRELNACEPPHATKPIANRRFEQESGQRTWEPAIG